MVSFFRRSNPSEPGTSVKSSGSETVAHDPRTNGSPGEKQKPAEGESPGDKRELSPNDPEKGAHQQHTDSDNRPFEAPNFTRPGDVGMTPGAIGQRVSRRGTTHTTAASVGPVYSDNRVTSHRSEELNDNEGALVDAEELAVVSRTAEEEQYDPFLVEFSPDDPDNPRNFSTSKKWCVPSPASGASLHAFLLTIVFSGSLLRTPRPFAFAWQSALQCRPATSRAQRPTCTLPPFRLT